mmetsp:Transcript_111643/g.355171  ORF Transcript_111643/g.355171 Transcript_111643/m.355171 type:complete len:259 (+) Transcript_111643:2068-2844(+)
MHRHQRLPHSPRPGVRWQERQECCAWRVRGSHQRLQVRVRLRLQGHRFAEPDLQPGGLRHRVGHRQNDLLARYGRPGGPLRHRGLDVLVQARLQPHRREGWRQELQDDLQVRRRVLALGGMRAGLLWRPQDGRQRRHVAREGQARVPRARAVHLRRGVRAEGRRQGPPGLPDRLPRKRRLFDARRLPRRRAHHRGAEGGGGRPAEAGHEHHDNDTHGVPARDLRHRARAGAREVQRDRDLRVSPGRQHPVRRGLLHRR